MEDFFVNSWTVDRPKTDGRSESKYREARIQRDNHLSVGFVKHSDDSAKLEGSAMTQ